VRLLRVNAAVAARERVENAGPGVGGGRIRALQQIHSAMQLSSGTYIPDGLLAANALLSEKLHQGSATSTSTLHQGFGVAISSTSLGIKRSLYDGDVRSRCTGKERDTESGNDYFGARYYASSMGRFMSPDDPFIGQSLGNPQSLNLYSYVQNNPLNSVDPDGHDCIHINNDTGAYESTDSGDCDNSTPEKANSGYYVDGTVSTIKENSSGQVTGYSGTSYAGNLMTGSFATPLPYGPLEGPANLAGASLIGNTAGGVVNAVGGLR
jgi:RHS repeat-associated protein